jgi:hypothetical protein
MYSRQKGILPGLAWLFGCFLILIPIYGLSVVLPDLIVAANKQPNTQAMAMFILNFSIQWLMFLGFFGYLASFFFKLFPALAVTPEGLSCIYIQGVLVNFIKWNEIQKITKRGDYVVLLLFRPGLPSFKGLHINSLYGRALGLSSPVLLLSPYLSERDEIVAKIQKFSNL